MSNEKREQSKPGRDRLGREPVVGIVKSGKPPSRRIQRPTSIRRPKLIGKSVEGAAMQAMAASRARASATRGSSPFKAVPSQEVRTGDPGSRASSDTSVTRVDSRDERQQLDAQSSQGQGAPAELSLLLKRYLAAASVSAASPFHHSRITQVLLDKHWLPAPERPLNPSVRDFFLTRSVHLWSSACIPFGFPERMLPDVSGYFAQWLKMSNSEFHLLQLDAPSQSASELSPSSTIIVELKRIRHRKLCVVLRTSLKYNEAGTKEPTLRCDAWMVMLTRVGESVKPTSAKRKPRSTVDRIEREATLVDKKVSGFAVTMNLEIQFFNFASFLIERSLEPWRESLSSVEMLALHQDMIKRYPFERQLK